MKKEIHVNFEHFIEHFPEIELPITLNQDSYQTFSENNPPLGTLIIEQYILPLEKNPDDELAEYIPCFRIPETFSFHAIVYWTAKLLEYQYVLVTFDKKGNLLDKRPFARTSIQDNQFKTTVATIDQDWLIHLVSGTQKLGDSNELYNPKNTKITTLELLADGLIVEPLE